MEKIASFQVNHLALLPGVYVSRRDTCGGQVITTFDVRMRAPNRDPVVGVAAMHTLEHLGATFLRNDAQWRDRVVYWGPMGCMTGFYLLVWGAHEPADALGLLRAAFSFMAGYQGEIPGATPRDCGNYACQDLEGAREAAARYLLELSSLGEERMRYPE